MWLLLTTTFRRWLLFTIAVPVAGAFARRLARSLETHRGPSALAKGLTKVADTAQRSRRSSRRKG